MNFLAILALVIEQARPLAQNNFVFAIRGWVRLSSRNLDTGQTSHAALAWCYSHCPVLLVWAVHGLLGWKPGHPTSVAVAYPGFVSLPGLLDNLAIISLVCDAGAQRRDLARQRLAQWQQVEW